MDVQYVRARVAEIADIREDSETAHGFEDDLFEAVLHEVAASDCAHAELAREALRTLDLDFPRWCA